MPPKREKKEKKQPKRTREQIHEDERQFQREVYQLKKLREQKESLRNQVTRFELVINQKQMLIQFEKSLIENINQKTNRELTRQGATELLGRYPQYDLPIDPRSRRPNSNLNTAPPPSLSIGSSFEANDRLVSNVELMNGINSSNDLGGTGNVFVERSSENYFGVRNSENIFRARNSERIFSPRSSEN